jgi:pimeloyl-[acyl-carrier protein] synthase
MTTAIYFNPFDPALRANPYPTYQQLLRLPPLRIEGQAPHPLLVISRYHDVKQVLRDAENFSNERTGQISFAQLNLTANGQSLLSSDPPVHTRLRRLISRDFTPRRVQELAPMIARTTEALLDQVASRVEFEVMADLANQLPVLVIAAMLGIPTARHLEFKRWSDLVIASSGLEPSLPRTEEMMNAAAAIKSLFAAEIEKRRHAPGDDLVSALVASHEAEKLDAEELLAFLILLLLAGNETTTNLIGNGLLALGRNPDQLARLRAAPELMPSAIEEMLRLDPPVQGTVRKARRPLTLGGTRIEPDDIVIVLIGAANRDPAQFADPDRFDITRSPNEHLAFGDGIHFCLGAPLARLEGATAIGAVLRRFPGFRLADPASALRYKGSMFLRGLASLPARID